MAAKSMKRNIKKQKPVREEMTRESPEPESVKEVKSFTFGKTHFLIILIVLIVIGLLYYFRGFFIAATVNGQPVYRTEVIGELEKQGGKQVLDSLITKTLILQEADKEHVTVSDAEINAEIKTIENNLSKQGQNLDQALLMQGMTRDALKDQIHLQKLVEKMVGKNIKITDKEIDDYLAKNKASLAPGMSGADARATAAAQLKQQKLSQKAQTWLQDLRSKAHIIYLADY